MAKRPQKAPSNAAKEDHGFRNAFDLFGILDGTGKIKELGGRLFESVSAEPDLLVGQPFAETVYWQSSQANARSLDKALRSTMEGNNSALTVDFRLRADESTPVELRIEPFDDNDGTRSILVWGVDAQKFGSGAGVVPNASDHLIAAAETSEIGLWFWDHKAERLYSNPACNAIFDVPPYEELTKEKFLAAVHPEDKAVVDAAFEETRQSAIRYEREFRVVHPDGSDIWVRATGRSFLDKDGKPDRMVGVVRKVTDQKVASLELARVYELEKKARDDAEIANRAKDFFLAFVSHELRSPLNAILGWSKILLTRELDDETRIKALETIEKSAQVQAKLINDLVDSARVASGKLRLEYRQLNLVDVVRSSFEALRPIAESQELVFEFESEHPRITVFGDSGRLQQVFGNLISNAVKFTPSGGRVSVLVSTSDNKANITVSDSGNGIESRALPNIFKQFAQGDAEHSRRSGGLGLGLSIVNILVGKHGGSVTAESEGKGKGSVFTVVLPLSDSDRPPIPDEPPARIETNRKLDGIKILIVEDDPDSREVLQIFLEQNGASVRTAESARAAMSIFSDPGAERPEVIISDLAMPEEDGYTFISRIRELPEAAGGTIPALALSAFVSAESKQRAFEAGFHRYLTKPFEPESIVDQIAALSDLNGNIDKTNP